MTVLLPSPALANQRQKSSTRRSGAWPTARTSRRSARPETLLSSSRRPSSRKRRSAARWLHAVDDRPRLAEADLFAGVVLDRALDLVQRADRRTSRVRAKSLAEMPSQGGPDGEVDDATRRMRPHQRRGSPCRWRGGGRRAHRELKLIRSTGPQQSGLFPQESSLGIRVRHRHRWRSRSCNCDERQCELAWPKSAVGAQRVRDCMSPERE